MNTRIKSLKKRSMVLGLVITDGVGYRNYVLSNFLEEAGKSFDRIIIYSGLPKSVFIYEIPNIEIKELPVFNESFVQWFWRKFKEVAHLQLHKKYFSINDNLKANYSNHNSNRGRATRLIYKITKRYHSENFIQFLENQQHRTIKGHVVTNQCLNYLQKDQPDILFFTHQRPPYVVPLYIAGKKLNIKTCSFIFSWDNLASKGRMAANFDTYFVWSELMKKELLKFYPSISEINVHIVGTPQFEPYVMSEYEMGKELFIDKLELDKEKKTLSYSCGDISTSRNDELYIETIATAIEKQLINENVNFIVRTSPAEEPDRFNAVKEKFPFIKWNFPQWLSTRSNHPEAWSQRVPAREDLKDLRALLKYSDLGINMCSTMSLDFMLFDKPVINPVFGSKENGLYNDQRFLKFAHYENVVKSGAVKIVKDENELISAINFYLQHPEADRVKRENLISMQIGKPLIGTSERIVKKLIELTYN